MLKKILIYDTYKLFSFFYTMYWSNSLFVCVNHFFAAQSFSIHSDLCLLRPNSKVEELLVTVYIYSKRTDFCQSVSDLFPVEKVLFRFRADRTWFQASGQFPESKSMKFMHLFGPLLVKNIISCISKYK